MRISGLSILGILAASPLAHADTTKTVSWFLSHPDEQDQAHKLCMNNPGEAQRVPDCLNAATAVEQSGLAGMMRRIPVDSAAQRCAEMPPYQRPFAYCGGYK
jgi:hypothetical protein